MAILLKKVLEDLPNNQKTIPIHRLRQNIKDSYSIKSIIGTKIESFLEN
jgi:hypothetical protein